MSKRVLTSDSGLFFERSARSKTFSGRAIFDKILKNMPKCQNEF